MQIDLHLHVMYKHKINEKRIISEDVTTYLS